MNLKNEEVGILEMVTIIAQVKYANLGEFIDQVFHDIKTTTIEIPMLQQHLFLGLKVLKNKQKT
jgi:hypothetical protein